MENTKSIPLSVFKEEPDTDTDETEQFTGTEYALFTDVNVARPGCLFSLSARPVRAGMKRYTTFPLINSDAYFYVFSVARFYV